MNKNMGGQLVKQSCGGLGLLLHILAFLNLISLNIFYIKAGG